MAQVVVQISIVAWLASVSMVPVSATLAGQEGIVARLILASLITVAMEGYVCMEN